MKILIAPDSFKESLTATEVTRSIKQGISMAIPDAQCIELPLADGGEGTVDALVNAIGGSIIKVKVKDPLMRDIEAYFGILGDKTTAVIEMAAASGLELLKDKERNPMKTTTFGTGQLIRAALDEGCKNFIIGIGGSSTNDGGAGMAQALGVHFLDKHHNELPVGGGNLSSLEYIIDDKIDSRIKKCKVTVASDVNNPLFGREGATRIYGPQKGATPEMVEKLESNLKHYGAKLEDKFQEKFVNLPGAGAAGGMGIGLVAFLNAELRPGFEIIKELTGLEDILKGVDLVVTGEGKMDEQTIFGKTPQGVASLAKRFNKPVIGIAGSLGLNYQELYHHGFDVLVSIIDSPMTLDKALSDADELLRNVSFALFRIISIGENLK